MSTVLTRVSCRGITSRPRSSTRTGVARLSSPPQTASHIIPAVSLQTLYSMVPAPLLAYVLIEDTFAAPVLLNVGGSSASNKTYDMTTEGIAWSSNSARFGKTTYTNDQVEPPPNWVLQYPQGYTDDRPIPDLSTFYALQVWMSPAGLPTFSKLALRNPNETMTAGTYQIDIAMSTSIIFCGN
jgi:LEM3 (ligand-effect modulator 3) family / CDC50 family